MKTSLAVAVAGALLVTSIGAPPAAAQDAAPAAAQTPEETAPKLSPAELDQMLAPIALYPDALLAQILMASTYPLELVEASRWLQDDGNAALKGDQLTDALDEQEWDESVKSLVPFPQVLRMMDGKLDWTERLGDAFLADQSAVMDAVQRLRQRADAAGKLRTTPQQVVKRQDQVIVIESPSPETVYVPVYDPGVVYGVWPYPAYEPYYFPGYFDAVVIGGFGSGWFGFPILYPYWGWGYWDWRHHHIHIHDHDHGGHHHHHQPGRDGDWRHDPHHRHGVPYRDAATRKRFGGGKAATQPGRGTKPGDRQPGAARTPKSGPVQKHPGGQTSHQPAAKSPPVRRVPPASESYGRGADVRAQADRGHQSRVPNYQPRPQPRSAPQPRSSPQPRSAPQHSAPAPRSGGGQHGDRRH